jgi:hypothetical protein
MFIGGIYYKYVLKVLENLAEDLGAGTAFFVPTMVIVARAAPGST